jgi:hypothetical protein
MSLSFQFESAHTYRILNFFLAVYLIETRNYVQNFLVTACFGNLLNLQHPADIVGTDDVVVMDYRNESLIVLSNYMVSGHANISRFYPVAAGLLSSSYGVPNCLFSFGNVNNRPFMYSFGRYYADPGDAYLTLIGCFRNQGANLGIAGIDCRDYFLFRHFIVLPGKILIYFISMKITTRITNSLEFGGVKVNLMSRLD